ncbi:MAG: sigma-70 family RNA polymerase sigma factor [Gammaproteobacteria bacterium]
MTQTNHCRQSIEYSADVVSIKFLERGRQATFPRPSVRERVTVEPRSQPVGSGEDNDSDDSAEAIDSGLSEAISSEIDELRIHCQNAPVLSADAMTSHAQQMEVARFRLVHLLIESNLGLQVMAAVFLNCVADGVDLSELINKNGSESLKPVQNGIPVQDTAKHLESKLTDCFERILNAEKLCEVKTTMTECLPFLTEIHFLPNYLQQVVAAVSRLRQDEVVSQGDEQWLDSIRQQQRTMMASRQAMINGNLRLVTFIAKQYNNQTMSFTDLIQDGTIGLIKAVDRYDWNRAVRFSTYAIYWIRQTITRAMVRQEKMVRLPYNMAAKASAVFEIMNNYLVQHNKWPAMDELAALCKLPEQEVKAIVDNYQPVVSLDSNINDDENMPEVIAMLEQHHFAQPLNTLISSGLKSFLRRAVGSLPEREAAIINCRFGLDNDHEMTLQDIADKMSLTRERVRQIQNSALLKLKNNFSGELFDFLEPG